MNRCVRVFTGIGVLVALGLSNVIGCSDSKGDAQEQPASTGKLRLGLTARAQSGNVYRLRNAFFDVVNSRTGEFEASLFSEDFGNVDEITTLIDRGSHLVTLQPGWFLEIVTGGGSAGTGGVATGGAPSKGGGGFIGKGTGGSPSFPEGGFAGDDGDFGFGGDLGFGGDFSFGGDPGSSGGFGGEPVPPPPPPGGFGGEPFPPQGGFAGFPDGPGQPVDAQLLSDAVQFFFLNGGDDAFVTYVFQVGGDVIDFDKGRLHIGIAVDEVEPPCVAPEGVIDPRRALFENSVPALSSVALSDAFEAIAANEGHGTDPELLYQQLFDSYASAENAVLPDAVHCGDETTDGQPSLNGYPLTCDRVEHAQVDNFFEWFATGFVNRMDLAPQNGAHCGQQRMIFSNSNGFGSRVFMIIEAQIPNPAPELGIQGCVPIARFWLDQNSIDDPFERGARLRDAFLFGHPDLLAAGFGPFLSPSHVTVGSGQIRTNNFVQDPWLLREFKLAVDGDELTVLPFPTAEAPNGNLFNELSGLPQGEACRENILDAMEGLLTNDPAQMSFVVSQECKDAESRNDFSQDYAANMSSGFIDQINERFGGTGLDAFDLGNRAWFAGSCIGCHNEAAGLFLGNGVFAPLSHDFVHSADFTTDCGDTVCFPESDAMARVFLPQRLQVMSNLLGIELPSNPCEGGGGNGGFGGFAGGAPSTGGSFGFAGSAGEEEPLPELLPGPAPEVEISLPEASTPVEELDERDAEIREEYGELTIGNRSAQVTH